MSLAIELGWVQQGTDLCVQAIAGLDDAGVASPSGLPGWSRAYVLAHLIGNARGLTNLATWARTGVETPMYASMEQRNADIEAGALLPAGELRVAFAESSAGLADALDALDDGQWNAPVRTALGRVIPATGIPWLRAREVMIHACDLLGGVGFPDLPDDFLVALIDEIVQKRAATPDHPALVLVAPSGRWEIDGVGEPVLVEGSLADIGAYVTGRAPLGPGLPAWL